MRSNYESNNPWAVTCIDSFNFFCCPECVYRSKEESSFQVHAVQNHPKSKAFFKQDTDYQNHVSERDPQSKIQNDNYEIKDEEDYFSNDPHNVPFEVKLEPYNDDPGDRLHGMLIDDLNKKLEILKVG